MPTVSVSYSTYFRDTIRESRRWWPLLCWRSALVPAAVHIMHFWPGLNPVRRAVRLVWRDRHFHLSLKGEPRVRVEGRYGEHADFHAVCEVFLERVYNLKAIHPPPMLVVDAGGHIGTFAVLASVTFPTAKVISFEPDPGNFAVLRRNIHRNGLRVEAANVALADFDGESLLAGPSSMGKHIGAGQGTRVEVRKLSELVDFSAVARLVMKVDVEGSEWKLLEECGPRLPANTVLFIETHNGASDRERMPRFAERHGFRLTHTCEKPAQNYDEWRLTRGIYASREAGNR